MGRSPCCDQIHGKKGPWTPEEDKKLVEYIQLHGHRSWRDLPKNAGLNRCGKSCRLRWTNYLRPDIKRGKFSADEEQLIVRLHSALGNKWSNISKHLPGRTDNEIKNYWNTHLKKRLLRMGIDPVTHKPRPDLDVLASLPRLLAAAANLGNPLDDALRLHADAAQYLANFQMLQNLVQVMNSSPPSMDATINLLDSATLRRYQLNDLLHATHKLEGIANGSLSLLGLVNPNTPNKFEACPESRIPHDLKVASNTGMINPGLSSYDMPNAHSTPPILVPASPEMETADCMQEQQDPCNLNSLTPCQGLQALNLGELDEDFSWKDIIDQISWSNES